MFISIKKHLAQPSRKVLTNEVHSVFCLWTYFTEAIHKICGPFRHHFPAIKIKGYITFPTRSIAKDRPNTAPSKRIPLGRMMYYAVDNYDPVHILCLSNS